MLTDNYKKRRIMRLRYVFWISIIICQSFILWTIIAQRPAPKTFTIVNVGDKPHEIVYIEKILLWSQQFNRAIEIRTGTYSRSLLLGDVLQWNKIFGEQFKTHKHLSQKSPLQPNLSFNQVLTSKL